MKTITLISLFSIALSNLYVNAQNPVDIGEQWIFLGDSETGGRANEPKAESQVIAFNNIWNQTFSVSLSPLKTNGVSGRSLQGTYDYYLSMTNGGDATLVHFQESGSQNSTQDTPSKFVANFDAMVRNIAAVSPNAVISTETAYSFEMPIGGNRDWTQHNIQMRAKIAELANERIIVHLAEVDKYIKELVAQKRVQLGQDAGQQIVWGDTDNSIARHYTGLGNLMIALGMFDALGYDVNTLDLSDIPNDQVSADDKQLCISIINCKNRS